MRSQVTWVCFMIFIPKLYSNALLASLNGRVSLRATISSVHTHMSSFSPAYTPFFPDSTERRLNVQSQESGIGLHTLSRETGTGHDNEDDNFHSSTDVIKKNGLPGFSTDQL
ncbi:hypothetical protein J3R30DRAFT_1581355 [Lentinula aciculospora]|uniref:Uncharacterized protein n=1 Tax=Lentinula aciculospora TaxID=153920 RepID=A0A9W9DGB8_9AGAR|nr:hypothetical protein J3R30DRAFT_1581355 [Lentinula aciculospora]